MATLNTVFKEVFSEGLKDEGFVKIKGRQPYIVRVVNGEILHIITCRNEWCGEPDYNNFGIYGAVATVYRKTIDLSKSPKENSAMFDHIGEIWSEAEPLDDVYWRRLNEFLYIKADSTSLYRQMETALEAAKRVILPVYDKLCDLDACMNYYLYPISEEWIEEPLDFEAHEFGESLLQIQTDNHDDFVDKFRKMYAEIVEGLQLGSGSVMKWVSPEIAKKELEEWRSSVITARDKVYQNPELHKRILEELQKRKERNLAGLRACGLKV